MLKVELIFENETTSQVSQENNLLNEKKLKDQILRDVCSVFAIFLLIGVVSWQSSSSYSQASRINLLLNQSDSSQCIKRKEVKNIINLVNSQSFNCN